MADLPISNRREIMFEVVPVIRATSPLPAASRGNRVRARMPAVEPVGLKCLRNQTQLLQCRRASLASMSVRQSARQPITVNRRGTLTPDRRAILTPPLCRLPLLKAGVAERSGATEGLSSGSRLDADGVNAWRRSAPAPPQTPATEAHGAFKHTKLVTLIDPPAAAVSPPRYIL